MARRSGGQDAARLIAQALTEYTEEVKAGIEREGNRIARAMKEEIAANSPVGATGEYKKGWKVTKQRYKTLVSWTVHNKVYQLVHLLERGHALWQGGRAKAYPHVKPAEDKYTREFLEAVRRVIQRGG